MPGSYALSERTEPRDTGTTPSVTGTHAAKIGAGRKVFYLGRFKSWEEARAAERAARVEKERTGRVESARSVYERSAPAIRLRGEHELIVAVLDGAVKDLANSSAKVRGAAIRWFRSPERSYLYSFATICDELGINPDEVRRLHRAY